MLKHYIHKTFTLPPHVTVRKVAGKIKRMASEVLLRRKDCKGSTYAVEYPEGRFYSYFPKLGADHLLPHTETIASVTKHYLDHRFDLLGSGWVQVKHGMQCRGLEGYCYDMSKPIEADPEGKWLEGRINRVNLEESQRIWKLIFYNQPSNSPTSDSRFQSYIPIDWHLDFKSGHRWSESTWYKDIRYGHKLGVDVKVPWELARMQHLPQIAIAYALAVQSSIEKWPSDLTGQAKLKAENKEEGQETKFENQERRNGQLKPPEWYAWEFRSQLLDFIATNPPRFGVNWSCTMDVGIRVANWLVAYGLFCVHDAEFDREFLDVFKRSVYEHGLHIINNLEWNKVHRGNHYLSDIVGLLFVAAYLPCSPETDAWLAFALQELITEVEGQFYPDGGNFEASTSYHRLSAEMVIYATALVLGLPEEKVNALRDYEHTLIKVKSGLKKSPFSFYSLPIKKSSRLTTQVQQLTSPFPGWYFERLEKMAEFTMHITKPNGHIPQIGDNDSGRFFKLQLAYKKMTVAQAKKRYLNLEGYKDLPDDAIYWDEDFLDHRHLVAAINGLFDRDDFYSFTGDGYLEPGLVRNMAGGIILSSYKKSNGLTAAEKVHVKSDNRWSELCSELEVMSRYQKQTMHIPLHDSATNDMKCYAYPDFGLYIYRSKRLYLAIRCGTIGQNGNGGHAHNDQLSIEFTIEGEELIVDPGTYLYTSLPDRRNAYRSVQSHFAPCVAGKEPGDFSKGLFILFSDPEAEAIYFCAKGFIGCHRGYGYSVYRSVDVEDTAVIITDFSHGGELNQLIYENMPFSPGYGKLLTCE